MLEAAIGAWVGANPWPPSGVSQLADLAADISEDMVRARAELDRREQWKQAAERGIDVGPRPEVPIPPAAKALIDQFRGRIGEDPDLPTMRRDTQLQRLQAQIDAEQAAARRAGYCCPLHSRTCEPPSELCCGGCTEVYHPDHHEGAPCVLGVTSE